MSSSISVLPTSFDPFPAWTYQKGLQQGFPLNVRTICKLPPVARFPLIKSGYSHVSSSPFFSCQVMWEKHQSTQVASHVPILSKPWLGPHSLLTTFFINFSCLHVPLLTALVSSDTCDCLHRETNSFIILRRLVGHCFTQNSPVFFTMVLPSLLFQRKRYSSSFL